MEGESASSLGGSAAAGGGGGGGGGASSSGGESSTASLITLVSAEKEKFAVPAHIAFGSGLVRAQVGDMGDLAEVSEKVLSLDLVESKVLAKVIEFMGHHAVHKLPTIEKPLKSCELKDIVPEWDANFVGGMEKKQLFDLIKACNYMDVQPLLDLACAKVASMIKGKTVQQIRDTFGVVSDFTEEEAKKLESEHKWAEEQGAAP